MYLSGTSMSASPIPIFGSPCSGPDCSSVIRARELGLGDNFAGGNMGIYRTFGKVL